MISEQEQSAVKEYIDYYIERIIEKILSLDLAKKEVDNSLMVFTDPKDYYGFTKDMAAKFYTDLYNILDNYFIHGKNFQSPYNKNLLEIQNYISLTRDKVIKYYNRKIKS